MAPEAISEYLIPPDPPTVIIVIEYNRTAKYWMKSSYYGSVFVQKWPQKQSQNIWFPGGASPPDPPTVIILIER